MAQCSVQGQGAGSNAYNSILSQDDWLGLEIECWKRLVKRILRLLTTVYLEHKAKAICAQKYLVGYALQNRQMKKPHQTTMGRRREVNNTAIDHVLDA